MPNAARPAAACRIARLDRQKFNDLMASGDYPCAPATTPGVPRVFEMPDLIGLHLFTRLTERNRTAKQAAEISCRIVEAIRPHYSSDHVLCVDHVAIAYGVNGGSFAKAVRVDENGKPSANPFASHEAFGDLMLVEVWNVRTIFNEVQRGLNEESRIVGDDD